jgi:outer membrane protein insertion porin family
LGRVLGTLIVAAAVTGAPTVTMAQDAAPQDAAPQPDAAQGGGGGTIREVLVQGNQRIEAATIATYLTVREGDPFDPVRIDRSLKNLFATGLFADVNIRRQGDQLLIRVVENPIINRISFEGNKKIEDDKISPEIQLRPRVVYTRTKVQQDVEKIL